MSLRTLLDKTLDHQRGASADDGSLGTTRNWSTLNAGVPCAVWSKSSQLAQDFYGGIQGDFIIATDTDLGLKSSDRFTDGTFYYRVIGWQKFSNAAISAETLYLADTERRTV